MRRRRATPRGLFPRLTPKKILSLLGMLVLALSAMLRGADEDVLKGTVTWVVDGDTVHVSIAGEVRKVRLIGLDTPEVAYRDRPAQYYGKEAADYAKKALLNRTVWLEYDVTPLDKYNRHLAYVWLEEPGGGEEGIRRSLFNARLLLEGYGKVMAIQPNLRYADLFARFQAEAREKRRGIWKKRQ